MRRILFKGLAVLALLVCTTTCILSWYSYCVRFELSFMPHQPRYRTQEVQGENWIARYQIGWEPNYYLILDRGRIQFLRAFSDGRVKKWELEIRSTGVAGEAPQALRSGMPFVIVPGASLLLLVMMQIVERRRRARSTV